MKNDINKIILGYENELALLNIEFTGLRADYENHVKLGQDKERNLNALGLRIHDKQNIISGYRKDFNIPKLKPPGKLPSIKRPAKKHIQKKRK